MKGLLPDDIINRVKLPFGMPLQRYFSEEFIDVADNILSKSTTLQKVSANKCKIMDQIKRVKQGKETRDNSLRQILFFTTLEMFNNIFLEDTINKNNLTIPKFL